MEIGYFGIIVARQRFWQGFFLHDDDRAAAETLLAVARQESVERYTPASVPLRPMPGVADEDQAPLGVLSRLLADLALERRHGGVETAALALHLLTGFKHFIVHAAPEKAGMRTTVRNLPTARTAEAVRREIVADPVVATALASWKRRTAPVPGTARR